MAKEKYIKPVAEVESFKFDNAVATSGIELPDIDFDKYKSGANEKIFK